MKKIILVTFGLVASIFVNAQQKNLLLDQSFWKTKPDLATVQAEIAKGNNPSESTANAFDAVVMAINNDVPNPTIKFLLEQPGNSVSKSTHDNRIYLHWAANKGNLEIVEYLIAKGSDITLEDSKGETPLTFAAVSGQANTALYDAFFKAGVDPKKKYKDGQNLLLMAIATDKSLTLSNYFVTKGMSFKDTDDTGNTAFDYAAKSGNSTLLKSLIDKGVKNTEAALFFAAQGSRREATPLETYQYLVENLKIKPTAINKSGETVIHLLASKPNQTESINYFLSKGVNANKEDNEGTTSLMIAASARDTATLDLLLPIVKNINSQNKKGESALTKAIQSVSIEATTLLLQKNVDVKVLDKDGNNLGFHLVNSYRAQQSAMGRSPENSNAPKQDPFATKLKLLEEKGLNLAAPQTDGSTLYHIALLKNDLALLKKLADLKIDVNAKNKEGLTALHKAAMVAKDDVILKYLLSIGANKEIETDFNETAYALAKENESLTKNNVSVEFLK